ncbi:MAG: hypothetical protein ABJA93_07480 [Sporichthyaceae bacterium]
MSESSFPFMGTQVGDAPAADLDESRGNRRTILILVLVLVGVLVLGALAYFFVFSGDDSPESASALPQSGTVTTPTPAVTPKPAKAPKLSKKAIGKDPFKALVAPAAVAAPAAVPGVPAAGSSTGGGTVVTSGGTVVTGGGTTTTGGGTGTSVTPLTVKVISVTSDNTSSRVTVGGKSYSVAPGDVFGTYFKALRLKNGSCGSFTYGDERFDLCEGDSARMK